MIARMRFNGETEGFDCRAGIPKAVCELIAAKVLRMENGGKGSLVLEVGCGTGAIGVELAKRGPYLGLDASDGMLRVFRERCSNEKGTKGWLVRADAGGRWPLRNVCSRVIFGSRVLHLLDAEHVVGETFRVGGAGAALLLGSVRRNTRCVKSRLREEMRRRLQEHGIEGRSRAHSWRQIVKMACHRGASLIEPLEVASWKVSGTPEQSMRSWRQKDGLAGIDLPGGLKAQILADLESWADRAFGTLTAAFECEETYLIEGVRWGEARTTS